MSFAHRPWKVAYIWSEDCDLIGPLTEKEWTLAYAAPDLLKSLTNLVDRYVRLVNSGDAGNWNPEEEKEIIEARAAIKQATGEKS